MGESVSVPGDLVVGRDVDVGLCVGCADGAADTTSCEQVLGCPTVTPLVVCTLPGTGHTTFQDRPEWLNPVVLQFLDQN